MIESNIINWIELGDSMQKLDVYGKKKMITLFNFLRILMIYNSFNTTFFIILHFIFFIQLAMLCIIDIPHENDWIVKIFLFFKDIFLLQDIIKNSVGYKIAIIIVSVMTITVIATVVFLMICIIRDQINFKLPITILNIIIILLIYYIIGPIVNICLLFSKCSNGKHEFLQIECFKNITHILLSVASIINLIFFLLFSLAMSLYYNEIGTLSNANVKTRINCNYEIYSNIAKILIFVLEYIIQYYGGGKKIYKIILEIYIFINCSGFAYYVYNTVLFHDERMNIMVHYGWLFTAWFSLGIFVKIALDIHDITAFIIAGWIILGIIYYFILKFREEYLITDFNILEAKEIKEIELFKETLLNLLFESTFKSKIYLIGFIKKFEEHLKTAPELNERYKKLITDEYLCKRLNKETTLPIYAIIYIIYEYHIKHANLKLDIALNFSYFLINKLKNPTYAIELCSSLTVEGYKHLYFKYMLMEGIKEYLVNKIDKSNDRTSVKHVQISSVILYNIYIDMFKVKIYDATTNQIDYFEILKSTVTTSKSTQSFLKVGENILKIRNDILTLWNKIVELNPFSDESAKDYMLYLQGILQDEVFASSEDKKYKSLKNNRLSERNSVYHQMFMSELSSIILIDGHNNNGKLLYMTPNFPNLFSFNGRELLNTTIDDLLPDTIKTFHKDLIENAIKFSNLNYSFKSQRDFILKGKNGGLYNVKVFIKCIPNLSFGLVYIGYITKTQEHSFVIVLDKDLNINGFTEMTKSGAPFTMNNNYGLTQSLYGHHIGTVIPEILLQMEYKDEKFIIPKNEIELKGNLYPVSTWKELDHKVEAVIAKIKENGSLQDKDEEKRETIKEYDKLLHEITAKYPHAFSVFYRISTRNFINAKYTYHRLVITNDLVNLNEHSIKDNKSVEKSSGKIENEINENAIDNKEVEKESKGIRFKLFSETNKNANVQKKEGTKKKEGEGQEGQEEGNEAVENLIDLDPMTPEENKAAENKNKEVKKILKAGSKSEDSSLLTKISVEMAGFNRLKGFILNKKETSNVRLMKILSILYGLVTIAFLVYDSIQNKNNLNDMGEYLKENLYFNHSKIAVAILYFSGLNLKWFKDKHISSESCPNRDCRSFYTNIMIEAINDIKTQKENFTKFYEDFRDILKKEQQMDLELYNLNYTDNITIDTDNLLNLLVFNGLKLKAGLDTYFDGSINGVFDIASSNLLKQSLNYFYSDISSFKDLDKEKKIKENFTLVPIALICIAVLFAALIIGFTYIVYKIYSNEIYFLEKLINFNSPNFDGYLKSLEDIKKKLRLENEEDEEKDEDMEIESKRATKKEEEEENNKKKKKINEKEGENKRKKKDKKSNKFLQVKQKKKRIMGMFFFKWNLFFTIKVLVILIISISYYLVSTIVNSQNKSNYLDFDQTTDAIEAVYKQTYELYMKLKTEMETFEERMRVKIDAINAFCSNETNETQFFTYTYLNKSTKNTYVSTTCNNSDCVPKNCLSDYAISCVNDVNCNKSLLKSMCYGLQCIDKIENYKMTIPSNEELTTPKLGSLLMPLVSGVDESSTQTEIKLNNLYNNDSCAILVGKENTQAYEYCSNFWSNILGKGMEQGITQLGLSVASVTDELNSLNDLSDVLNKNDNNENNDNANNTNATVDNPLTFDNLTKQSESAFFQFSIFVEYYLFESYLQTYQIFNILRDVKLENIKNSFNIILYIYLVGSILLLIILFYFVYESKYLLNSFLNFVGIFPVKYLMEDNALYHETLNLEQDVF
jgi:hypothetical protein